MKHSTYGLEALASRPFASIAMLMLLGTLAGCARTPPEDPTKQFEGSWTLIENGKKTDKRAAFLNQRLNVFKVKKDGDAQQVETVESFNVQVDAAQTPPHIDLVDAETSNSRLGIYELDGNTLKICVADMGEQQRPTDFTPRNKVTLMILERNESGNLLDF